jgi:hypothetical protein
VLDEPGFPIVSECRNGVVSRHFIEGYQAESEPERHLMSKSTRRATTDRKQGYPPGRAIAAGRRSQGLNDFVSPLARISIGSQSLSHTDAQERTQARFEYDRLRHMQGNLLQHFSKLKRLQRPVAQFLCLRTAFRR